MQQTDIVQSKPITKLLSVHEAFPESPQSPPPPPTLTQTNFAFPSSPGPLSCSPVQPSFSPPIFPTPPSLIQHPSTPRIQASFSFTSLLATISGYPFLFILGSAAIVPSRIFLTLNVTKFLLSSAFA